MLWLWRRLAATAQIRPLAWESPYAAGAALERQKRQKKKKKKKKEKKKKTNTSDLLLFTTGCTGIALLPVID